MKSLPPDAVAYKATPEFDQDTIPAALLGSHTTKAGTWGRIVVSRGRLLYRILEPALSEHWLEPGRDGVVEPTVRHEVEPHGEVRFHVEFLRRPKEDLP